MSIIALLITISLTIALLFLGIFLWSMKSGQYDDTYTPSVRMLFDDKPAKTDSQEVKEIDQPAKSR
jgi:cbb3-type cytochrome oxidase maturation protein